MRSIESLIGFEDFPRIRVGIGKPAHGLIDHVLGVPNDEEAKLIDGAMMQAAEAAELIIAQTARRNGFRTAAALQKLLLIIRNRFKFGFDYTVPRRRFGECFLNERRKTHKPRFRILNLFNAERIIRRINGIRVHVRVFKEHFLTL